jgi:hypothetical protein
MLKRVAISGILINIKLGTLKNVFHTTDPENDLTEKCWSNNKCLPI